MWRSGVRLPLLFPEQEMTIVASYALGILTGIALGFCYVVWEENRRESCFHGDYDDSYHHGSGLS